jgi:hypothetical protein
MRTPLGPSRTSGSLHRTASTSDILIVTRRHARATSVSTDALTVSGTFQRPSLRFDLRAEGLPVDLPVRAGRGRARERLPSYREPASRNPQTEPAWHSFKCDAVPRTVSPSLHSCPRQAVLASFLLASALFLQSALRPLGEQDARCVRPTSATYTNYVYPYLVRSRLMSRLSPR